MMKSGDVKVGITTYPEPPPGVRHGASPAPHLSSLKNESGETLTEWAGNSIFPPV